MNSNQDNIDDEDLTLGNLPSLSNSISTSGISTGGIITWNTSNNSIGQYALRSIEDFKEIFIFMMKELKESQIENILNTIKEKQPNNYNHCLINLIAYPNFKLMSDQFMINRYEDIKKAMNETYKHIDFNLTYGILLDTMPGFKLLLKI
jgi:hypothetical protein